MSFEKAYRSIEKRRIREGRAGFRLRNQGHCREGDLVLPLQPKRELLSSIVSSVLFLRNGLGR